MKKAKQTPRAKQMKQAYPGKPGKGMAKGTSRRKQFTQSVRPKKP